MFNLTRVVVFLIIFLMFSQSLFSWGSHDIFTFLVATSIPNFDYQKLVEIRDYDYVENRRYNTEKYVTYDLVAHGKAKITFDSDLLKVSGVELIQYQLVQDGKLPVWAIFYVYSRFPDNGMDFVEESGIVNAILGDTQANRHAYLKVTFFEYMEGDKSFLHFIKMSKEAFRKGDEYWGYRFLSYALHYLEDLMQPYHVRPGTVPELIQFLFDPKMRVFLRNAHSTYDDYMTFLLTRSKYKEEFYKLIREAKPLTLPVSDEQLIYEAILFSYSMFFDVHDEVKKAFGEILYNRRAMMEDFEKAEEDGKLARLYELTKKLASVLASLCKGVILKTALQN
ncbi:hypothetical protein SAMN04488510_10544 [Fervidobacterium changbaicum]|uniref:Uncharacterized protein n=1 Tax=Fervidobacterium changbaicum TaxID=310769 RepID=A0AAE5XBP7_9BACT|nr:hypothetical protein [Fervidobacterium changbaicum]QAV33138.1 hypothetical protein CBS1_04935 [Fervidobacterium changbaicum]SDH11350.1 hypothetical protein SAMN04488510_10544 [Fervidobacterium changbaicum]